jgi:hypothetical protein
LTCLSRFWPKFSFAASQWAVKLPTTRNDNYTNAPSPSMLKSEEGKFQYTNPLGVPLLCCQLSRLKILNFTHMSSRTTSSSTSNSWLGGSEIRSLW